MRRTINPSEMREIMLPFEGAAGGVKIQVTLPVPVTTDYLANLLQEIVEDTEGKLDVSRQFFIARLAEEYERTQKEPYRVLDQPRGPAQPALPNTDGGESSAGGRRARTNASGAAPKWDQYKSPELEKILNGPEPPPKTGKGNLSREQREWRLAKEWEGQGKPSTAADGD